MGNLNTLSRSRQQRLLDELRLAVSRTPGPEMRAWGLDCGKLFGEVTFRRGKRLVGMFRLLGQKVLDEGIAAADAYREERLTDHSRERAQAAVSASKSFATSAYSAVDRVGQALKTSPRETAPALVVSFLAFMTSSGGLDGDGGAPDLDLVMGIDAHRSIFTHSIISGAVIETLLGSTARLISIVHVYLPENRDPVWDAIAHHKDKFLRAAAEGASAGISYHLLVDTVLQPGTYHDLPGTHSFETHEAILGANAVAEGIDVKAKKRTFKAAGKARAKSTKKPTKKPK